METEQKFDVSELVENWAPPPPVIVSQGQSLPHPQVPQNDELEFESTLSTLVDHFNALPPPAFGEPPEMPELTNRYEGAREEEETSTKSHSMVWMIGCSLLLGGTLAAGGIFALNYGVFGGASKDAPEAILAGAPEIAVPEAKVIPEVKIVLQTATSSLEEKAEPQTEPLNETKSKTATVLGAPISKPIIDESEEARAGTPVRLSTVVKKTHPAGRAGKVNRKAKRLVVSAGENAAPAKAASSEWEDPYK